jgi:hypothetical protein
MALIPDPLFQKLLANAAESALDDAYDPQPVVKLFTPDANATWLLTEVEAATGDQAFGLCDLGLGSPELGWVSLTELAQLRGPMGLAVEVDAHFRASGPISLYAKRARRLGRIV